MSAKKESFTITFRNHLSVVEQSVATVRYCRCYLTEGNFPSTRKEKERKTLILEICLRPQKNNIDIGFSNLARTQTNCYCEGKQIEMELPMRSYDGLAVILVLRLWNIKYEKNKLIK